MRGWSDKTVFHSPIKAIPGYLTSHQEPILSGCTSKLYLNRESKKLIFSPWGYSKGRLLQAEASTLRLSFLGSGVVVHRVFFVSLVESLFLVSIAIIIGISP